MPAEDDMTIDERRKYLNRMRERYWGADRRRRGELLTEMEAVTGLHRKSLIRLVRAPTLERKPRGRSRGRAYGAEVEDAIRVVWESLDHICAERLTPALLPTAQHLGRFGELLVTEQLETQLARISRATVQRCWASCARIHRDCLDEDRSVQTVDANRSHGTAALGDEGARTLRGRSGAPLWRSGGRGVRSYPAVG